MKLSEGQGAELLWRDCRRKRLTPLDALKIYALKTAPAFEAALYAGLRLAGPLEKAGEFVSPFARHLGVAFQILNDLNDWQGDGHNKLLAGGDVLGGRPTLLYALALEGLPEAQGLELEALVEREQATEDAVAQVRQLFNAAGVFEKAHRLVDKYQERAESVADEVQPDELRRLLYYLVDTVLGRSAPEGPTVMMPALPVVAGA
jgi:geranylgeranyl pyrophosphate synthase